MLNPAFLLEDPETMTTWPDGSPRIRARSERVYRPANKREWRSVYWMLERVPPNEMPKPTDISIELDNGMKLKYRKHARKQYSFSSTKYGDENARRKAEAILQFIDLTGLLPPLSSITATDMRHPIEGISKAATRKPSEVKMKCPRKSISKRYRRSYYATECPSSVASSGCAWYESNVDQSYSWPIDSSPAPALRLCDVGETSSAESMNMEYLMSVWKEGGPGIQKMSPSLSTSTETMAPLSVTSAHSGVPWGFDLYMTDVHCL